MRAKKTVTVLLVGSLLALIGCKNPEATDVAKLNAKLALDSTQEDLKSIYEIDGRLTDIYTRTESQQLVRDLPRITAAPNFEPSDRVRLQRYWVQFLHEIMALDLIKAKRIPDGELKEYDGNIAVAYYAWIVQYYHAIRFMESLGFKERIAKILNDSIAEKNIPSKSYSQIKDNVFGTRILKEFIKFSLAIKSIKKDYQRTDCPKFKYCALGFQKLLDYTGQAWKYATSPQDLKQHLFGATTNSIDHIYFKVWFPAQKGIAAKMGDTRLVDPKVALIRHRDIENMKSHLKPGDIILVRHNWYLSNIGLPGFWPHAAIYMGSPEELNQFFDDPAVQARYSGNFLDYLKNRFPAAFSAYVQGLFADGKFQPNRVLEAESEGVRFNPIEHTAHAEYVAALRPLPYKFTKLDTAQAIENAFSHFGKPYDFEFSFRTEDQLVCTELVYRSWGANFHSHGLHWNLIRVSTADTLPANEMARQFVQSFGTSMQELELVYFLDGNRAQDRALESGIGEFIQSVDRPKWSWSQN